MVDLRVFADVENIVRRRLEKARPEIERSLACIADGNPLGSETEPSRRLARLQTKASLSRDEATIISSAISMVSESAGRAGAEKAEGPEAIWGATLDFVGVSFFERGRRAADAVGRVAYLNEAPQGTGFMVTPRLFLTNNHVIDTPAAARRFQLQFDYEYDRFDRAKNPTSFFFDPDACFVFDTIDGLDYTLIAVGERRSGARALDEFGFIPLSDANDKHMLGETANVIQHPAGRFKELVLRENKLVARDETEQVLHYVADTEQGSSGSPVFNNDWEPIALHHWAGPWREVMSKSGHPLAREINEGIRISAIVKQLREKALGGADGAAVRQALMIWETARRTTGTMPVAPDVSEHANTEAGSGRYADQASGQQSALPGVRHNPDGSVTWTFPIEISVRAPLAGPPPTVEPTTPAVVLPKTGAPKTGSGPGGGEAASWKTEDFSDRGGYEAGFIPNSIVDLPDWSGVSWRPALNQEPVAGDDPHALRYHHFSIVMNADRRLAGFTAVNIDGGRIRAVNRDDKTVIDNPTLAQLGVESFGGEGAEASDDFRPDRRILETEQMNRPFYEKQIVPGFPDPTSRERIARMFQKGHIILRGDPAWGSEPEALAAERDTFFYTNAAPQVGFFNQGSALNRPGSKGKLRWRAVETYVLRNAVTMKKRINVFAGPIFDEKDPAYRFDSKVPMRFWKIAVWNDGTKLRSIALLADQKPVLQVMPEAFGQEAFDDDEELARVSEFLSSVAEIEELTGLDFGKTVREGDIRSGSEAAHVPAVELEPDQLTADRPAGTASRRRPAATRRTTRKR